MVLRPDWSGRAEPPPFGASFAVRRRLFEKIGLFRVDLALEEWGWGGARKQSF